MDPLLKINFSFTTGFRHNLERGTFCKLHRHPGVEIVFHKTGKGTTTLENGMSTPFERSDIILYSPKMAHDQRMHSKGEDVCIQATPRGRWPAELDHCFKLRALSNPYVMGELEGLTSGAPPHSETGCLAYGHRVTALLITLYEMALKPKSNPGDNCSYLAGQARMLIAERFARIQHLGEVAEVLDISEDYLRHSFKEQFGISMIQWLTTVRLERSKELLVHSPLPLKEISRDCGFSSQQYFSRIFKKASGMTPAGYRMARRGAKLNT